MKLEDLPVDLLSLILNGNSSWAAIVLWKCGSLALNSRLANGGITHVELRDSVSNSRSLWPQCLAEFKLEHLSIYKHGLGLGSPQKLRQDLRSLNGSKLRVLELRMLDVQIALFPSAVAFSRKRSSIKVDVSGEWLADAWPLLERLTVSPPEDVEHGSDELDFEDDDDDYFSDHAASNPSLFGLLPRSLTSLEFTFPIEKSDLPSSNWKTLLPPNLLTLNLHPHSISVQRLTQLPTTLTAINKGLDPYAMERLLNAPELLPNLVSFPPTAGGLNAILQKFRTQVLEGRFSWPSIMHRLEYEPCWSDYGNCFESVPPNLTELVAHTALSSSSTMVALESSNAISLPPSLRALHIVKIDWSNFATNLWPRALTTIKVSKALAFGAHCFQLLPRTLKTLVIDKILTQDKFQSETSLADLESQGRNSLQLELESWTKAKEALIKHCKKLEIADVDPSAYFSAVEAGGLCGLPVGLTELSLGKNVDCMPYNYILPPGLTSFTLDSAVQVDDRNFFSLLPPSGNLLLHIRIAANSKVKSKPSESGGTQRTGLCAANSLRDLDVVFDRRLFRKSALNMLPRCLSSVTITYSPTSCVEMAHLPPNLTIFNLTTFGVTPNQYLPKWVQYLPRTLTHLKLSNLPVQGRDVPHLPPKLDELSIYLVNTTVEHLLQMPRTLRKLKCSVVDTSPELPQALAPQHWRRLAERFVPFWRLWECSNVARELGMKEL